MCVYQWIFGGAPQSCDLKSGRWRKLKNYELRNLFSLQNFIGMLKSWRLFWKDKWCAWANGKFVPLLAAVTCKGSRGMGLIPLNLGTRWRWLVSFSPRPLCPPQRTSVRFEWEAGWVPDPAWKFWREEKYFPPAGMLEEWIRITFTF